MTAILFQDNPDGNGKIVDMLMTASYVRADELINTLFNPLLIFAFN